MKALDWQRFLLEQQRVHLKTLFSVAELANVAQTDLHGLNTELGRLIARGIVCRYAQGFYGIPDAVSAEELIAAVDAGAYLTGLFALFRHNLVTQVPTEVTCFTNRRHNRKSERQTSAGRLCFVSVPSRVYSKPRSGVLAPPEEGLCDFVWLNVRDRIDPRSLVTFRNLRRLDQQRLVRVAERYPANVGEVVTGLVKSSDIRPA
jgi:hypothetical protein